MLINKILQIINDSPLYRRFLRATGGRSLSTKPRDEDIEDEYSGEVAVHPETQKPTYVWDSIKNRASTVCRLVQPMDPSTPKPEGKSVRANKKQGSSFWSELGLFYWNLIYLYDLLYVYMI